MPSFRLITEGVTDQVTLEILLSIFYRDPNIDVERLQPPLDETDRFKQPGYGGWGMVFHYLQSVEFKEAFEFGNFFTIIQIDSDVSQEFNVPHQEKGNDLPPGDIADRVKQELIRTMGDDFYREHRGRIIFAVSVHSIECWFLPLYYTDNRKAKTKGCINSLNQMLKRKEKFVIDPGKKNARHYEKISKQFGNRKKLLKLSAENPSFKLFVDTLPTGS